MSQKQSSLSPSSARKGLLGVVLILAVFVVLAVWAGIPDSTPLYVFIGGIFVFVIVMAGFALAAWHLLLRPLPPGHKAVTQNPLPVAQRQLMAVLLAMSGIAIVIGAFWDEVWHRQYGVPFGEDLLWRPHLMLYAGFLSVSALAFIGLYRIIKYGKGTLQQRFRSDPIMGMLVLVGAFLIYAIPADPLWHLVYGEDISAWSLPHLLLSLSFVLIMLLAAAIQLSTTPARTWSTLRHARPGDLFLALVYAFALMVMFQILVTEWDAPTSSPIVQARPDWMFPAILVGASSFIGVLALHSSRLVGMATAVALVAVAVRMSLIALFGFEEMTANPLLCTLAPMVALDLWYGLGVARGARPSAAVSGLVATVGFALISLPLINRLFAFPTFDASNLLPTLLIASATAVGAAWLARTAGDYLGEANKQIESATAGDRRLRLVPPVGLALLLAFILIFILTASPPI